MAYAAPLRDIRFVSQHLAGLNDVLALPAFESVTPDVVDAVLEENARFMEAVVAPLNRVGDTQPPELQNGIVTTSAGFKDAFTAYVEGGWQGLLHPEQFGGQALPKLVATACAENLDAACLAFSLCPLLTDGVIEALLTVGTPAQQTLYVPPLIQGRWTGTMNLTEPDAGSDLARVRTRAVPQPDGSFRLFGQKIFITFGEHDLAENILHLVLARTPDAPEGVKGLSLFMVPKILVNADGSLGQRNDVVCASLEHKLGIHGSPTAVLLYGDGKTEGEAGAVGYLVGDENRGLEHMFIMMNAARFAVGLQGVAVSERATQHAVAYASQRVQGHAVDTPNGPHTIDHHPDVQRMLLQMKSITEAGRAIAYVAAATADYAQHHPDSAQRKRAMAAYEYMVPVIKGFCTEMAQEVVSLGVQVHGGMGYIEETGAAQYFRDARILPIYEGTTAIQANDFLGRKTLKNAGAVAVGFMTEMQTTVDQLIATRQTRCEVIARYLAAAINDYKTATEFVLQRGHTALRDAFAGSVPYLMLAGLTHGGWQMARAALICQQTAHDLPDDVRVSKLHTSYFYATHILPRSAALRSAIVDGAAAVGQT